MNFYKLGSIQLGLLGTVENEQTNEFNLKLKLKLNLNKAVIN